MRKKFTVLFLFCAFSLFSYPIEPTIEAKAGYFFFANPTMRKIYYKGGLDVQLAATYPLVIWDCRYALELYSSVQYLERSGKSLGGNQNTSIWELPVDVGLRPLVSISPSVQYYFSLGPRYLFVHQHNSSDYVPRTKVHSCVGLFVNTGFNFLLQPHVLLDLFGEYCYAKTHFSSSPGVSSKSLQVGGFTFGGGLGYVF